MDDDESLQAFSRGEIYEVHLDLCPPSRHFCLVPSLSSAARKGLAPGAVIYGVVPPLFGEKPYRAVTARLDYLRDQGVDILWLTPVNATDDIGMISYSITDYASLRPDFGTDADFRELIKEAHARGMKVIMDFVPNHTSAKHPMIEDIRKFGKASPFYSFYDRDTNGEITHYFDWSHLMNLNYSHSGVSAMMANAFKRWVRDFGVDGFRVDAAWGVRERNPEFWPRLVRELSALKPDVVLLAEASARDPYYVENGFDLAYDWSGQLGEWAWKTVFTETEMIGPRLHAVLTSPGAPMAATTARFLNNNDTGARFITTYGLAKTKVAAVLQHTLPGVPLLFTGDETGAEYQPYDDPSPLNWHDPAGLHHFYRKLAHLRKLRPALRSADWRPMPADNAGSAYSYLRLSATGEILFVVLNFGPPAALRFRIPPGFASRFSAGAAKDLLNGTATQWRLNPTDETVTVGMGAESALVLELATSGATHEIARETARGLSL